MNRILLFSLIFISFFSLHANEGIGTTLFDEGLGEKNFDLYAGPRDPLVDFKRTKGAVSFQDERIEDHFIISFIEQDIANLSEFWSDELRPNATCPQAVFEKNYSYIRYLFRLISLSYQFELLNSLEQLRFNVSGHSGKCSLTWDNIYRKCKPKSLDMQLFLKRARYFIDKKFNIKTRKLKDRFEMKKILKGYIVNNSDNNIAARTLKNYTQAQERTLTEKTFLKEIDNVCTIIVSNGIDFCSERDDFYAGRNMPFLMDLVMNSNATNALRDSAMANGCVKRFLRTSRFKTRPYKLLEQEFPSIYRGLKSDNVSYLQGRLFLPGALKEFDDLGMKNFLYTKKKIVPKPTPKIVVKKKIVKEKPKVVIAKPTPKPVVVIKPNPTPIPVWEDHFYKAVKKLRSSKKKKVAVNLEGLIKDYPFTPKMIKRIAEPLSIYQRVKSLRQMKKYDKIGSKKTPVILSFLMYMISYGQHQGLYNVVMVLGNEFYVVNNFDKKHQKPTYIDLRNDESTGYQWQLQVVKK